MQSVAMKVNEQPVKYPDPKILLLDMSSDVEKALRQAGYNVSTGSFGTPYRTPKSDSYSPLPQNHSFPPNYTEQDIVIVDLAPQSIMDRHPEIPEPGSGEKRAWSSCEGGLVDPRPFIMSAFRDDFDRILEHGGIIIVFTRQEVVRRVFFGAVARYSNQLNIDHDETPANWDLLSVLAHFLTVKSDVGQEVKPYKDGDHPLQQALRHHSKGASFECVLNPHQGLDREWLPLLVNRYNATVAAAITPTLPPDEDEEVSNRPRSIILTGYAPPKREGWVFLFPQLSDIPGFLVRLLTEALPNLPYISPRLFPYAEGLRWTERPEYELPGILSLRHQIDLVEEEARKRIATLEGSIEQERAQWGFLHDLVRETGDPLVRSVKKALEVIGFTQVIDADEELERSGQAGSKQRREDLRIEDSSPLVLVEIKGVGGLGSEEDTMQVFKYLGPRMRSLGRTDVRGISILNHQRHLPPLDRNKEPFQPDVVTNALEHDFGLITTWDLYRLVRSYIKLRWTHEQIRPLFYRQGRIEPVPGHYEYLGTIQRFIPALSVIGIQIEAGKLLAGDRIAFELSSEFDEQEVISLQIENQVVKQAESSALVGVKTHLTKEQARLGTRVFRIVAGIASVNETD
jgi:hypothetical protein